MLMPSDVFQRDRYDGIAREVAVWWTLRREATKGEAVCRMFTHVFGHELRLEVRGELVLPYTPGPSSLLTAVSGTCKEADGMPSADNDVPDNSFIKTNTMLKTDVSAFTTGSCDARAWGEHYWYEYHTIDFIGVEGLPPGGDPVSGWNLAGYFANYTTSFIMDSLTDNTTPHGLVGGV